MSRFTEQHLYIDGKFVPSAAGNTFQSINPANGDVLAEVHEAERADVDRAVEAAKKGQKIWAAMTAMERSRILRRAVEILRERNDELAELETLDTGKPFSETQAVDIVTGADVLEYYAGLIPSLEGQQIRCATPLLSIPAANRSAWWPGSARGTIPSRLRCGNRHRHWLRVTP